MNRASVGRSAKLPGLLTMAGLLLGACGAAGPAAPGTEPPAPETAITSESVPPAPPALSPGEAASNSVTVTWKEPDTELQVSGYDLRWRRAGDSSWTEVRGLTETSYTLGGLDAGIEYEVQVRARYAGEEGEWSRGITAKTAAAPAAPGPAAPAAPGTQPPSGHVDLTPLVPGPRSPHTTLAAPRVYQIVGTKTGVTAFWLPVLDTSVTGFELQWRSVSATTWTEVTGISSAATWHTVTGLEPRTGYEVRVRGMAGSDAGAWWTFQIGTAGSDPSEPAFSVAWKNASYTEAATDMKFVLSTDDPVPDALTVRVFVASCGTMLTNPGLHEVAVPAKTNGRTEVEVAIALEDDTVDEPDCVVFATWILGDGYRFGSSPTATVTVSDNDDA